MLERRSDAIRFHPTLLGFAGAYRYEPRQVAIARGNEKGRVERAIRCVRDAFFAARSFTDLDDLNAQAEAWSTGPAADRRCPDEPERTVRDVFAEEQSRRHRQLVVDGIAEGAMGCFAVGDRRDYAAISTPVASAQVVNA